MTIKLKDIKLFEWIDLNCVKYLNMLIDQSRREEFKVWDIILKQWDESNGSAYIIQSWEVSIDIDWKLVSTLTEWDIFWEIALITDEPRVATVIANTDLVLLKINRDLLHTIIKEFKNWKDIQKIIIERIKDNMSN